MANTVLIVLLFIIFLLAVKKVINLLFSTEEKVVEQIDEESPSKEKQRCEKCAVGKANYEIDEHSEVCPFLAGRDGKECGFFKPSEEQSEYDEK
ncbi:MAG: hypothetical protein IJD91_04060 [Clostridia bacterium]|nr:hypothetical protein [Clostridia bacterium]